MSNALIEDCQVDGQSPTVRCTEGKFAMDVTPTEETVSQSVRLFKLLADETRLRILLLLRGTPEMNVLQLCEELRLRQPSVSHHLALLRVNGLIEMRREGKHNYYHILPQRLQGLFESVVHE